MLYGYVLTAAILGIALVIATGTVEEKTSFGLMPIVVVLGQIGNTWAQWAFGSRRDKDGE